MFSFFFPFAHRLSYTPSGILYVQCRYSCFFSLISSSSFSHLIGLIRIVYNNKLKKIYFLTTALGIPIDIVPTSKSCVFCWHGIAFLFFHIWQFPGPFLLQGLFSSLSIKRCYACIKVPEKSQSSDSCGFTNLLYYSLKCHDGDLLFAEERNCLFSGK